MQLKIEETWPIRLHFHNKYKEQSKALHPTSPELMPNRLQVNLEAAPPSPKPLIKRPKNSHPPALKIRQNRPEKAQPQPLPTVKLTPGKLSPKSEEKLSQNIIPIPAKQEPQSESWVHPSQATAPEPSSVPIEQKSKVVNIAQKTEQTLTNRSNYDRLMQKLTREKLGQDTLPTSLNHQLALLSPGQIKIYEHKIQQAQKPYINGTVPENVCQALFHQVQLETRRDVMETYYLGDSLDPNRRKQLQALYDSRSPEFKQKVEDAVEQGLREHWGTDPTFRQQTKNQLRQVMRDRYLINSDGNAMEIAYLGHNLTPAQTKNVERFYNKLSPEQKQTFNQKAATEYHQMWGMHPPSEQEGGRIRWLLRVQKLEQSYGEKVYCEEKKVLQPHPQQPQSQANPSETNAAAVESFKKTLANNAQQKFQHYYHRLELELKEYRNLSPDNPKWQQLRQLSQQDQQNSLQSSQRQMQVQHPVLAVIDTAVVAQRSNAELLGQINQELGKIQFNIKDLSQQIQKDPSTALLFDEVVEATFQDLKIDPNNPAQAAMHQAIVNYIQSEQNKANLIQWSERLLNNGLII